MSIPAPVTPSSFHTPSTSPTTKSKRGNRRVSTGFAFNFGYSAFLSSGFRAMVRHAQVLGRRRTRGQGSHGYDADSTGVHTKSRRGQEETQQRTSFLEFPMPPQSAPPAPVQYFVHDVKVKDSLHHHRGGRGSLDRSLSHLDDFWSSESGRKIDKSRIQLITDDTQTEGTNTDPFASSPHSSSFFVGLNPRRARSDERRRKENRRSFLSFSPSYHGPESPTRNTLRRPFSLSRSTSENAVSSSKSRFSVILPIKLDRSRSLVKPQSPVPKRQSPHKKPRPVSMSCISNATPYNIHPITSTPPVVLETSYFGLSRPEQIPPPIPELEGSSRGDEEPQPSSMVIQMEPSLSMLSFTCRGEPQCSPGSSRSSWCDEPPYPNVPFISEGDEEEEEEEEDYVTMSILRQPRTQTWLQDFPRSRFSVDSSPPTSWHSATSMISQLNEEDSDIADADADDERSIGDLDWRQFHYDYF